jgi:predicted component of type VI protein secretion system
MIQENEANIPMALRAVAAAPGEYAGVALWGCPLCEQVRQELDTLGGQPSGLLFGDYAFDHTLGDVPTLQGLARIAENCQAPLFTNAGPALLVQILWPAFQRRPFARITEAAECAPWRALLDGKNSRSWFWLFRVSSLTDQQDHCTKGLAKRIYG